MTDPADTDDADGEQPSHLRENSDDSSDDETSRRGFLGALVAGVATLAGLAGYGVGTAEAATPSGDVGTATNPYRRAYVDRVVFVPRTSDPSSPSNGTLWYNENA